MTTDKEVEAAENAIAREMNANVHWSTQTLARAALAAAEQVREDEAKTNCTHPRQQGSGSVSGNGGSTWSWYCPDCGAHEEGSIPATNPTS